MMSARLVRHAVRALLRDRAFTVSASLTLALGIGLSTAVFTVSQALLVRELPVRGQDEVVVLWGETPDRSFANYPLSYDQGRDFLTRARSLESAAFYAYHGAWPTAIRDGDEVSELRQAQVTGEFFDVLGVRPVLGRTLRVDDDRVGARPVAVLSHAAWLRVYGGAADAVGRHILLHRSGVAHEIVGVMPPGLELPHGTEFWVPLVPSATQPGKQAVDAYVHVVGRLARGAPLPAARDELTAWFGRPEREAWLRDLRAVAMPLPRLVLGDVRPALITFMVACALLLLITCTNVASLLLVRGVARQRELAVRAALGADRRRVIGQLLAENAVLAALGGALGILVAAVAVHLFVTFAPSSVPRLDEIRLSAAALLGAFAITGVALVIFSLAPVSILSRVDPQSALRGGRETSGRRSRLATEGLVAAQIVLSVVVLSAAGLLVRSLSRLERAHLAIDPSRLLIGELSFRSDLLEGKEKQLALLERMLAEVRALPGVSSASPVLAIPFSGSGGFDGRLARDGQSAEEAGRNPILNLEVVVPEYFATFGLAPVRGRVFSNEDVEGAPPVVVLSEAAARSLWGGDVPLGKKVRMGTNSPSYTVVGIVPDTRYRDLRIARASVYFPLRQSVFPFAPLNLAVRATGDPAGLAPSLRRAIARVDPGLRLTRASTFENHLDRPLEGPRLNALLVAVFAGASLTLAAVGLFGAMAAMVRRRVREIGVRMALGATHAHVFAGVMGRGLAIAWVGATIGLVVSVAGNRLLVALLYEVSPTDVPTYLAALSVLFIVSTAAIAVPARSSTRVEPAVALRTE
jgi:putative ABC transport system permease protein